MRLPPSLLATAPFLLLPHVHDVFILHVEIGGRLMGVDARVVSHRSKWKGEFDGCSEGGQTDTGRTT